MDDAVYVLKYKKYALRSLIITADDDDKLKIILMFVGRTKQYFRLNHVIFNSFEFYQ